MKCPNCFTENSNSRFCVSCGEPLTSTSSLNQKLKPKQSGKPTWTRPDHQDEEPFLEESLFEDEAVTEEVQQTISSSLFLKQAWKTPSMIFTEQYPPNKIGGWILGLYSFLFGLVLYIFSIEYHELFYKDAFLELIVFPATALFVVFIVAAIILLLFPTGDQKLNFPSAINYMGWSYLYPTAFMLVACVLAFFESPIALFVLAISLLLGFGFLGGSLFIIKKRLDPMLHLGLLFLAIGISGYLLKSLWLGPIVSILDNPFLFS
ncbi:zinc ribbon domain-containing protein [Bacillaceae bacterium S4-13-58]